MPRRPADIVHAKRCQILCPNLQNANVGAMPLVLLNAKRLRLKAKKFLRFLSVVTCQLSLVILLSACTVIGTNRPAALQITTTPEASIFLDGKHIGKTPFSSDQLQSKEYQVKLTSGEATFAQKITLSEGTLTVINWELNNNFLAQSGEVLSLEKDKKGLFVVSMPQEADLIVDGTAQGKTPFLTTGIEDGDHKVSLAKVGFVQREFAIKTSKDYRLVAQVTLASEIAKGVSGNSQASPLPKVDKVEITNTPQGFLRVRSQPSLTSTEIGRAKPKDQYEILEQTDEWIKINFEGKLGWISKEYTKKL